MTFIQFIFTKTFWKQIVIALVVVIVLIFLVLFWLKYTTNHNEQVAVPDLSKLNLEMAKRKLDELDLRLEILDSANFNPEYPKYSVIEQIPATGKFVKENRKIYITLNPSGYRKVEVPPLVGKTLRQTEPTLRALGFEIGTKSYKPNLAPDVILEMRHKGKEVKAGDELQITSIIDLVIGDGKLRYTGEEDGDYQEGEEGNSTEGVEIIDDEFNE